MSVGVIADYAAMSSVRGALDAVADGVVELGPSVAAGGRSAALGAGEFAISLAEGSAVFVLSWSAVLAACATGAGLLAGHVDASARLLAQVDGELAVAAGADSGGGRPR